MSRGRGGDHLAGAERVCGGAFFNVLLGPATDHQRCRGLDVQPVLGAMLLAEYGDPAALPRLSAALDACAVDPSGGLLANGELVELEAAIAGLGGTLSESQAQKVGTVLGDWEARPSDQLAGDDAPERRSTDAKRRRKKAQRKMKKKAQRRNRR